MAKRIIEISVNDEYVVGSGVVIGAAGSHNDVVMRVTFDESWDGLYKYATFRDSKGENPVVVMITALMLVDGTVRTYDVPVPAAAEKYEGQCSVTFTGFALGYDEEGKATILDTASNTAGAKFRVLPSDFALADDGSIDATLAQQLEAAIDDLKGELGDLGEYEDENGKTVPYTVEGRLDEQDEKIAEQNERIGEFDEGDERSVAERLATQDEEIKRIAKKADSINNYDLTNADKEQIAQMVLSEYVDGNEVAYTGEEVSEDG